MPIALCDLLAVWIEAPVQYPAASSYCKDVINEPGIWDLCITYVISDLQLFCKPALTGYGMVQVHKHTTANLFWRHWESLMIEPSSFHLAFFSDERQINLRLVFECWRPLHIETFKKNAVLIKPA